VDLCGGEEYTVDQFCQGGTTVVDLCRGWEYTAAQFCRDGSVVDLCGGGELTAAQFCQDGTTVRDLCDGKPYAADQACKDGELVRGCNDVPYDPFTDYCDGGSIKPNPVLTDARNNKTYRTVMIGSQRWMAQNLNIDPTEIEDWKGVANSWCYEDKPAYCDNYGRLYDWATTMERAETYNEVLAVPSASRNYQGICPSGWHVPNDNEWNALATAVGGQGTAGTKLKVTSGWTQDANGTDEYGFSALPGGYRSGSEFSFAGAYGFWWSSSEVNGGEAHRWVMPNDYEYLAREEGIKSDGRSVRCIQD
jgi:uncharacterized protein (TIGR02145 family)